MKSRKKKYSQVRLFPQESKHVSKKNGDTLHQIEYDTKNEFMLALRSLSRKSK